MTLLSKTLVAAALATVVTLVPVGFGALASPASAPPLPESSEASESSGSGSGVSDGPVTDPYQDDSGSKSEPNPFDEPTATPTPTTEVLSCKESKASGIPPEVRAMLGADDFLSGSLEPANTSYTPRTDYSIRYNIDARYSTGFDALGCAPAGQAYLVVQLNDLVEGRAYVTQYRYEYAEFVADESTFSLSIDGETFVPESTEAREDGGGHVAVFLIPELDASSTVDFKANFDLKFTRDRGADKAVIASDASYGSVPDELRVEAILDIAELKVSDDELRECRNGAKTWCG